METLVLDGKRFVKASKAARAAGYTSDYVGQLCRAGKITAHLVGRSWYVNEEELGVHRTEKKRTSRVKAREQVRKAVEEHHRGPQRHLEINGAKHFEQHSARYEKDQTDLMPEVRKVTVVPSTMRRLPDSELIEDSSESYTIENEGDKVVMSGTVSVVDATDESMLDEDTVVLKPTIDKRKQTPKKRAPKKVISPPVKVATKEPVAMQDPTSFLEKLDTLEEELGETEKAPTIEESEVVATAETMSEVDPTGESEKVEIQIEDADAPTEEAVEIKASSLSTRLVLLAASILIVSATVILESNWKYISDPEGEGGVDFEASITVDTSVILDKIPFIY